MNKNKIDFKVYRTKEGTIFEVVTGLLVLISIILGIVLLSSNREGGVFVLCESVFLGFLAAMLLVLAYMPKTFNVPDDATPAMFIVVIRFLRMMSVSMALLCLIIAIASFLSFPPQYYFIGHAAVMTGLIIWYIIAMVRAKQKK